MLQVKLMGGWRDHLWSMQAILMLVGSGSYEPGPGPQLNLKCVSWNLLYMV